MIEDPDDYQFLNDWVLCSDHEAADEELFYNPCVCSAIGPGDQFETRIVPEEDLERLEIRRYCPLGAPCLIEAKEIDFLDAAEMRKALDEPPADWGYDNCAFCGTTGLRGDDGVAISCPECRDCT